MTGAVFTAPAGLGAEPSGCTGTVAVRTSSPRSPDDGPAARSEAANVFSTLPGAPLPTATNAFGRPLASRNQTTVGLASGSASTSGVLVTTPKRADPEAASATR